MGDGGGEREGGMRDEKRRGWGSAFFFFFFPSPELASLVGAQPPFYVGLLEKPLESPHKACRGVCVCKERDLTDIWLPGWHHS